MSTRLRMTLEVDQIQLFDAIKMVQGDKPGFPDGIGERLVGAMLTGETSFFDAVGLAVYGIHNVEITSIEQRSVSRETEEAEGQGEPGGEGAPAAEVQA